MGLWEMNKIHKEYMLVKCIKYRASKAATSPLQMGIQVEDVGICTLEQGLHG